MYLCVAGRFYVFIKAVFHLTACCCNLSRHTWDLLIFSDLGGQCRESESKGRLLGGGL